MGVLYIMLNGIFPMEYIMEDRENVNIIYCMLPTSQEGPLSHQFW